MNNLVGLALIAGAGYLLMQNAQASQVEAQEYQKMTQAMVDASANNATIVTESFDTSSDYVSDFDLMDDASFDDFISSIEFVA